jgi:heme-degrading monooxygenase HmoA
LYFNRRRDPFFEEATMRMIISWGHVKPGTWSEFERLFLQADAATQSAFGLRCRWLLRDLDDADAGFAISLWNSAEAMDQYLADESVRELRRRQFNPLFVGDYIREPCEVRVVSPGALDKLMLATTDRTTLTDTEDDAVGGGSK